MGRKWQKNTKQGGGKGGKGQPQKKRRRGSDSDSSDDERGQKRAKAAKNNANAKKISEQGNSSFLTHASQMSDQIAKIPKEDLEGLPSFQRNFWTGPVPEADGMDSLKATRKSLGILVKGPGSDMCPPPISTVTDAGIPTSFAAAFTKLRLSVPTLVQMQSWPSMLAGNNLLCIAPTGSGKTLAYGLPLLPHITHQKNSKSAARGGTFPVRPSGLVLVPTRELALQVAADFKALKALASIKVVAVYGGQDKDAQLETLVGVEGASPADVIVATPGRLIDLMSTKHISLSSVTYLVLDEADRMLALGFEEQLNALSDHIRPDKQAALFSATFPGRLRNACDKWIGEAVTLRVSTMEISNDYLVDRENKKNDAAATATATSKAVSSAETQEGATLATESATTASAGLDDSAIEGLSSSLTLSKTVTQEVHVCVPHKKPRLLIRYILRVREKEKVEKMRQPGPMIIFCAKIKTISYLIKFVTQQGLIAEKFHGQLAQSAREKVLNDFKAVCVMFYCSASFA